MYEVVGGLKVKISSQASTHANAYLFYELKNVLRLTNVPLTAPKEQPSTAVGQGQQDEGKKPVHDSRAGQMP